MANTGIERSLTLTVTKKINGIIQPGYPIIYQGRTGFGTYDDISVYDLAVMTNTAFNERLSAFKTYVETLESGLNIDADLINDSQASRENLTSCPID